MSGNGGNGVKLSSKVYFRNSISIALTCNSRSLVLSSGFHLKWNSAMVLPKIVRNWHTWSRLGIEYLTWVKENKNECNHITKSVSDLVYNMACQFHEVFHQCELHIFSNQCSQQPHQKRRTGETS